MKLSELIENPDNPSVAGEVEMKRLEGKLERVPSGLTAMRIAYVTDQIPGKKVVLSGNKRLRCLKSKFGEDGEAPDEWFQDITGMSQAERHEFIVDANISDGRWDVDKLLAQYDVSFLKDVGLEDLFPQKYESHFGDLSSIFTDTEPEQKKNDEVTKKKVICPHCGKEIEVEI